jgi:S-adenosylmethionine hydrolase
MALIVTLTTDFGTADGYVGAMKGVILARAPAVTLIDITHDVPAQDVAAAAFALAKAAPCFPAGTIHLVVVDPGVGSRRRPVILEDGAHRFVGPDNGVFALVAPGAREGHEIVAADFRRPEVSPTFHGRDIFAPAAARLAAGASPAEAGPRVTLEGSLGPRPLLISHGGGQVTGHVVHVDRFGNLITDLPAEALPPRAAVRIGTVEIRPLRGTYTDVAKGQLLAYVGSSGTLEIAVRDGSAAETLDLGRGAAVLVLGDAPVQP